MATQRYISTSFWDDEWISTLNPSEKLMYLYLMTNPLTNIAGVYKLSVRRISFDTGFNKDTVNIIIDKFEIDGKVYQHGEYIIIPSWPKHQKWQSRPKIKSGIEAILKELPGDVLQKTIDAGYEFPISKSEIPHDVLPYDTSYSDSDSDLDLDSDSDTEEPQRKKGIYILKDGDRVPIGTTTYDRICKTYGKRTVDENIEKAYAYAVGVKGRKSYYKDYALTAENYIKRAGIQPVETNNFLENMEPWRRELYDNLGKEDGKK